MAKPKLVATVQFGPNGSAHFNFTTQMVLPQTLYCYTEPLGGGAPRTPPPEVEDLECRFKFRPEDIE